MMYLFNPLIKDRMPDFMRKTAVLNSVFFSTGCFTKVNRAL